MDLKNFLDEAFNKGKNIKEEIVNEIFSSKMLSEVVNNDLFVKAVSKAIETKEEVTRVLRHNIQTVFKVMDVPSRSDLENLNRKIDHLEKSIDKVGKRSLTATSLRKINRRSVKN